MSRELMKLPTLKVTSFTNVSTNIPGRGLLVGVYMAVAASAAAGGVAIATYATLSFDPIASATSGALNQIAFLPVCLEPTATASSSVAVAVYIPLGIRVTQNQNLWLSASGSAANLFMTATPLFCFD